MSQGTKRDPEKVAAVFAAAFTPNPRRHGVMKGYDPQTRKKLSATVRRGVAREDVLDHLLRYQQHGRLGYLPGREDHTDVVVIDIDQQEQGADFDRTLGEVVQALRSMGLPYYQELSTNGGMHLWVFLDDMVPWEVAYWFVRSIVAEANHPYLETFPSSATSGVEGKWIYMPYSGALSEEDEAEGIQRGLGVTWLTTRDHDPVPVWKLNRIARVQASTAAEHADRARSDLKKLLDGEQGDEEGALASDLDTAAMDQLRVAVLSPPASFRRHDSIAAFLNLGARAGQLEQMIELLRSQEAYIAWVRDDSRTLGAWQEEIDRWAMRIRVDEGELRGRYGIKTLIGQGFTIGSLKKRVEYDLAESDLNKIPEMDLARKLWELMRMEGQIWWYDPSVATGFRWDGLTYVPDQDWEDSIKRWIDLRLERFGKYMREGKLTNVYKKLERVFLSRRITEERSPDLLACENGVLNWREGTLQPAHPDIITVGRVNARWDPRRDPEEDWKVGPWHAFLQQVLHGQPPELLQAQIRAMAEFFGYSLVPLTQNAPVRGLRKILNLHGPSSTGKTTTWRAVLSVLGDQAESGSGTALATSADPELFSSQDWAQRLVGKHLAVFDEMQSAGGNEGRKLMGHLKILAGNGAVTVNPKGKKSTMARLGCRIVMCTNFEMRLFEDSSNESFFRRLLRIPFENVVQRQDEKSDYETYLTQDDITRGDILMWMVDGLRRLAANNWSLRDDVSLARSLFDARAEANPVIAFLRQRGTLDAETPMLIASDLLPEYNAWLAENGMRTVSVQRLNAGLADAVNELNWGAQVSRKLLCGYTLWAGLGVDLSTGERLNDLVGVTGAHRGKLVRITDPIPE